MSTAEEEIQKVKCCPDGKNETAGEHDLDENENKNTIIEVKLAKRMEDDNATCKEKLEDEKKSIEKPVKKKDSEADNASTQDIPESSKKNESQIETAVEKPAGTSKAKENKKLKGKPSTTSAKSAKKPTGKKKKRAVQDQEIPDKKQTTLKQHFPVRRSERKLKSIIKDEEHFDLTSKILSGIEDGLEVRSIEGKGRGVFSKKKLKKGDFVCEYAGDLISIKEARKREDEYEKEPEFGCYMYFFDFKNQKYCVDATRESGKLGRLLNHSRTQSNVCTKLFPINDTPRLILIASKDVALDEELLYDYGDRSKSAVEAHPWLKT